MNDMDTNTRRDAGQIASIIACSTHTDSYPELAVMVENLELRDALARLVSWIRVFEAPTWTDEYLNREGDASLRWLRAAEAALAASA